MNQIFAVKLVDKKYLEKDVKLYTAFSDLEKAHNKVDKKTLGCAGSMELPVHVYEWTKI